MTYLLITAAIILIILLSRHLVFVRCAWCIRSQAFGGRGGFTATTRHRLFVVGVGKNIGRIIEMKPPTKKYVLVHFKKVYHEVDRNYDPVFHSYWRTICGMPIGLADVYQDEAPADGRLCKSCAKSKKHTNP